MVTGSRQRKGPQGARACKGAEKKMLVPAKKKLVKPKNVYGIF
jgi:hypothetical protein